jgi:RNA polymerase sigma-70 factor (ECF subfamily)
MNDLHEPTNLWESLKQGRPEALRYFFHFHHYRIYCYLLRLTRDQEEAQELTQNAFIVLFHSRETIEDAEHLLQRLYLNAQMGFLLRLKGKRSSADLEVEMNYYAPKDAGVMDDPEIARNETLIALQGVMQKLPPVKRQVAELYFFQGFSLGAIARHLGLEEQRVKAYISETLKRLGEELEGKRTNKNKLSVVRA